MKLDNYANLSPEALAELERELPEFGTLLSFVVWGREQAPPVRLVESIAQDEYTHDSIAIFRDGLVLTLGST